MKRKIKENVRFFLIIISYFLKKLLLLPAASLIIITFIVIISSLGFAFNTLLSKLSPTAQATTSGQMKLYFQRENPGVNTTYNALTLTPPTATGQTASTTVTALVAPSAPCESAMTTGNTINSIVIDDDSTPPGTGDNCLATFYSLPVGQAITLNSTDASALSAQLYGSNTASDNANTNFIVRLYKYDGNTTYTQFGTLTTGDLATGAQTRASLTATDTPCNAAAECSNSTSMSFLATDRIVAVLSINIIAQDSSSANDTTQVDFGSTLAPANVTLKYTAISPNKPNLTGTYDDDFAPATGTATTNCTAGATVTNTKFTCGTSVGAYNVGGTTTINGASTSWIWVKNVQGTLGTNFGTTPSNTYIYQTVDTNTNGDGTVTTVVNSTTNATQGTSPYYHSGLVLWASNTDYLILAAGYDGTNRGVWINNSGSLSNSTAVSLYNRIWLRWTKASTGYQAAYSTDGSSFTNVGTIIAHSTTFTRAGLTAYAGTGSTEYAGAFEYFDYDLAPPVITVGTSGSQTSSIAIPSTNTHLGGAFTFVRAVSTANVTSIKITDNGTASLNATNFPNLKLVYETDASCNFADGSKTTFSSSPTFSSETATFAGSISVSTSQVCIYIVTDVSEDMTSGQTLDLRISNPFLDVLASAGSVSPGTAVDITGSTTFNITTTINISGNVYSDEAVSPTVWTGAGKCDGSSAVIALSVNGGTKQNTTCNSSTGAFTFSNVPIVAANKVIVVFMDTGGGDKGVVYTKNLDTSTAITGIKVTKNRVRIQSESGQSITNANIDKYDVANDPDIPANSNGSSLTIDSGVEIHIATGITFAPGGNVTTDYMHVKGTYTGAGETLTLSGAGTGACTTEPGTIRPLCIDSGTFTAPTNVDFVTSSGDVTVEGATYSNLNIGTASDTAAGRTFTLGGNTTVTGTVTVGNASSTNTDTLNGGSYTLTLSGSGTPLSVTTKGAFNGGSGTVSYTNTTSASVSAATYNNLDFSPASETPSYSMGPGSASTTTISRSTAGGVKIDDAGDPGSISGNGRHVVQTSSGVLYAFINDGTSCEIWSSQNGSSWTEQDANNNPSCVKISGLAIDKNNIIHLLFYLTNVQYKTFDTSTNTFGSSESVFTSNFGEVYESVITVDGNNKPHVAIIEGDDSDLSTTCTSYVHYKNKVGTSWSSTIDANSTTLNGSMSTCLDFSRVDIVINEDNIPELSYLKIVSTSVSASVGNANNATSFTNQNIDTTVNLTSNQADTSIGIDSNGNTWISYIDATTNYVSIVMHNDLDAWSTWQSPVTNSNVGSEPSLAMYGQSIHIFYQEDSTDQKIAYDVYDSGVGAWKGETVFATPGAGIDLMDVHVRYSNYNFSDSKFLDVLYSDGTDIYWNVLDTSSVKIKDANDQGTLTGASRQIVKTPSGNLYAFVNDSGSCEIWKSTDGIAWVEKDSANNPTCSQTDKSTALAIDTSNVLHLAYINSPETVLSYITFSTSTDTFGVAANVMSTYGPSKEISIAIDSNNKVHGALIYTDDFDGISSASSGVDYFNKVNVGWTTINLQTHTSPSSSSDDNYESVSIAIDEDNLAEVSFVDKAATKLTAALSKLNSPSSISDFSLYNVDISVNTTTSLTGTSIAIDNSGNTQIAYVDATTNYITLAKRADGSETTSWSTGWTTTTNNNVGYEPSIAISGSDVYVFYQDDQNDIVYDKRSNSTWSGESVLQAGTYKDSHAKWSYLNNTFGSNRIDYLYSDNTDVYYSYLSLRDMPVNVDNSSDFGALPSSGRQILRTSGGVLYSFLNDGGNCEIWKSTDGKNWGQMVPGTSIACTSGKSVSAAIDSVDDIHVIYVSGLNIYYRNYDTTTDSWDSAGQELVRTFEWSASSADSIAVDQSGVPHVVYVGQDAQVGVSFGEYNNRASGAWKQSASAADLSSTGSSFDLVIDEDSIPEISYIVSGSILAYVGNQNDASSFTSSTVKSPINNGSSIAVDQSGNTWVAYSDATTLNISLAKRTDGNETSSWSTGWTNGITNSNPGYEPSIAIVNSTIYVIYQNGQNDIVYNTYDGSSWGSERVLEEGTFQDEKSKWSFVNSFDSYGVAPTQISTYYFDGSDATATDPNNVWANESNIFDSSITTNSDTNTIGSTSSNFVLGEGTNAPSSGNVITSVKARIYGYAADNILNAKTINAAVYTDGLSELLGTASRTSFDIDWGGYTSLSTPSGGWTWTKVQALETKVYANGVNLDIGSVYKVEILVETSNYSSTQNEIDYLFSDGTDVYYNKLSLSSGSSGPCECSITIGGNLTIAGSGNATLASASTNPTLNINGSLTIGSGDTFTAPASSPFTLAGSFTNIGTFTHSNGTITFDGAGTSTISGGSTTFYNFTSTAAGKVLRFQKHTTNLPLFTFSGTFTITGSSGNNISIQSDTSGSKWLAMFATTQSISYATVQDSGCNAGSANVGTSNSISGGNNDACWQVSSSNQITVGSNGTQATTMSISTAGNYLGGAFTFIRSSGSANITQIKISETGTINAASHLSDLKIYYETAGSCVYNGTESVFNTGGTGVTFSSDVATVTGTMSISTSQVCAYVVFDIANGASGGQTIEMQITDPTADITVDSGTLTPNTAVAISGATTINSTITLSGNVYADEAVSPTPWTGAGKCDGSSVVVSASVNGGTKYSSTCNNSTGAFSMNVSAPTAANQIITVFIDNHSTDKAVLYTKNNDTTSNIIGLTLTKNRVWIQSESSQSITNGDINTYDLGNDTDIPANSNGTSLIVDTGVEVHVNTGDTFAPGGDVTTDYLHIKGTYTGNTETLNLTGSGTGACTTEPGTIRPLCIDSGAFTTPDTVNYQGSTGNTTMENTGTYKNLGIGNAADTNAGVTFSPLASTSISVQNTLTIGNASSTNSDTLLLSGPLSLSSSGTPLQITSKGTLNTGSNYVQYNGTSATTIAPSTYYQLFVGVNANSTATTYTLGGNTVVTRNLQIGNASSTATDTLDASSYTLTLNGEITTPFVITPFGNFTPSTSTVLYNGSGNTITEATYYNLQIVSGLNGITDTLATTTGKTITVNNNLTLGDGVKTATINAETNDPILDVNGSVIINSGITFSASSTASFTIASNFTNNGTFTANSGTVTFDATSSGKTISGNLNGTSAFYKAAFNGAGGGWTITDPIKFSAADAIDTLVIGNGTVTLGNGTGDNMELLGKMTIANTVGQTGTFQTAALPHGQSITIDVNANSSTPTCANCIITVGATSGAGQGNLIINKNSIVRLNPRSTATASDTGIEVETTGYLNIQGSQDYTGTSNGTTNETTITDTTKSFTATDIGKTIRMTSGLAFGKTFLITAQTSTTLTRADTTSADTTVASISGSGSNRKVCSASQSIITADDQEIGRYLRNISNSGFYFQVVDSVNNDATCSNNDSFIITDIPHALTNITTGNSFDISDGIMQNDQYEVFDYAYITAENGISCNATTNEAGEAYIYAKINSETTIQYAYICNLGRNNSNMTGITYNSVDAANANSGLIINKSIVSNMYRAISLQGVKNNNGTKGVSNNKIFGNTTYGIYSNVGPNSYNDISYNLIYNNTTTGIDLTSFSNSNFIGNYIYGSPTLYGINLTTSSHNTIQSNTFYGNLIGLRVSTSTNNYIVSNKSFGNGTGIVYRSTSTYNISTNNSIYNNSAYGYYIDSSDNNKFIGNSAIGNNTTGLMVYVASLNTVVINESYGSNGTDLSFNGTASTVYGFNSVFTSSNEVGGVTNTSAFFVSKRYDGVAGSTKIWGKYITQSNNTETPQTESTENYNFTDNLWDKSTTSHGYSGTGTEDSNLDYDLSTATLSGGPYAYRLVNKTAGNGTTAVFDVYRNGTDVGDATAGTLFTDTNGSVNVKFKIDGGGSVSYVVGDTYTFVVWDASNDTNTQKATQMQQDGDSFFITNSTTVNLNGKNDGTAQSTFNSLTGNNTITINGTLSRSYNYITVTKDMVGSGTVTFSTGSTVEQVNDSVYSFGSTSGSNTWTFYNLKFNNTNPTSTVGRHLSNGGTGSIIVNGDLTIGDSSTRTMTLRNSLYNRTLDINGNLIIGANGSYDASTTTPLTIAGNFTNNGTFTHSSGTVTFDDNTKTTTIGGSSSTTFNNLTSTTAGKTIKFKKHTANVPLFTLAGTMTVTGSSGNLINLTSDTDGSPWLIHFNSAQSSITYANVKDSACDVGTSSVTYSATNSDGGNNGSCWNFPSGAPTVDIVDGTGSAVTTPAVPMSSAPLSFNCQVTTGTLGTSTQKIRVSSPTSSNWSMSIAPTNGSNALWSAGTQKIDFNDPNSSGCTNGSDGDSYGGQLTINPAVGSISPQSGCTLTGVNIGNSGSFAQGSVSAITLASATGAQSNCYWDLTNITVSQKVPAEQPVGNYSLNLTITVVAQ